MFPSLANQTLNESLPKIVDAKKVTVDALAEMCISFYKKHICKGTLWRGLEGWRYGQWFTALSRIKSMCESEDVDPSLYLESQFCTLSLWSRNNGNRFYPNMLMGANAVKRYESFKERNKRHTKNIAIRSGDIDHSGEILAAETMYGELILKNRLWKLGGKPRQLAKMVINRFPRWQPNNPAYAAIRRRALMVVLDRSIPACSTKIFVKRDFAWISVARFIKQSGYDTLPTPNQVESDLKGLLITLERQYA